MINNDYVTSEAQRAANKRWKQHNPDKVNQNRKRYRESHPDYGVKYNEKSIKEFDVPVGRKFRWSNEELRFLIDNYYRMSSMEIASYLHRSYKGVSRMKEKLGLHKSDPLTDAQKLQEICEVLRDHNDTNSEYVISRIVTIVNR